MPDEIIRIILFIIISHIFVAIFSVYIGIQIGKSLLSSDSRDSFKPKNKPKENNNLTNNIKIDDAKVVLDINTKNLTKKFDSLGETKTSSENISSSINKLKNMKG
jgi:hypothetical protein